jgi:hypothetical protein
VTVIGVVATVEVERRKMAVAVGGRRSGILLLGCLSMFGWLVVEIEYNGGSWRGDDGWRQIVEAWPG